MARDTPDFQSPDVHVPRTSQPRGPLHYPESGPATANLSYTRSTFVTLKETDLHMPTGKLADMPKRMMTTHVHKMYKSLISSLMTLKCVAHVVLSCGTADNTQS